VQKEQWKKQLKLSRAELTELPQSKRDKPSETPSAFCAGRGRAAEKVVDADWLAREILDAWYARAKAGDPQSPEFLEVVDKACVYRDAKHIADIYCSSNILRVQELIDVERTRRELLEA
jgi:hypothetical protein